MTLLADWQLQGPLLALWPYRNDVWRADAWHAQQAILQLLMTVSPHHPVRLGIHPPQLHTAVRQLPKQLAWFAMRYDDAWLRDTGPLFLNQAGAGTEHRYQAVAGDFNGWQGVHYVIQRDRRVAAQLSQAFSLPLQRLPLVFEGGMLSHDGAGTALVHAKSLQARNPSWRLPALAAQLQKQLGLTRLIWVHHALSADETGGHVDNQIQFIGPQTIACAYAVNEPKWNAELDRLRQQLWAQGYHWVQLPTTQTLAAEPELCADVQRRQGVRRRDNLPRLASYVNFIRLAKVAVVPQFQHSACEGANQQALASIRAALPECEVIGVDASEMILGGGGPHCLSLVLPR